MERPCGKYAKCSVAPGLCCECKEISAYENYRNLCSIKRLKIDLMHMEIKYLEEFLKTNSKNQEARERLEYLKEAFAELAQHAIVVD